jgi:hypothetical protein
MKYFSKATALTSGISEFVSAQENYENEKIHNPVCKRVLLTSANKLHTGFKFFSV